VPVWAVCGRCELEDKDRAASDRILELSDIEPDAEKSVAEAAPLLQALIANSRND
jgi:glycerate kinase